MSDADSLARVETPALVAVGGFVGANARYALVLLLPRLGDTLVANVLGSFLLGLVLYEAVYAGTISPEARTVLATGFLSSFTTYSTFAVQSVRSAPAVLAGNVLANYALGFGAVLLGRALARRVVGRDASDPGPEGETSDPGAPGTPGTSEPRDGGADPLTGDREGEADDGTPGHPRGGDR